MSYTAAAATPSHPHVSPLLHKPPHGSLLLHVFEGRPGVRRLVHAKAGRHKDDGWLTMRPI